MKKSLKITLLVILIIVTIVSIIGVLYCTGVISFKKIDNISTYVNQTEDGRTYTQKEWVWEPNEFRGVIEYADYSTVNTKTITLNLSPGIYYDITIPDIQYFYDFGKTVWASDGSFVIRVIGNVTQDNLSTLAGINNSQSVNQYTVETVDGAKGVRIVAKLVDDVAIIANIYNGNENYSIIKDSIVSNEKYEIKDISYSESFVELDSLMYTGKYVAQYTPQDITLEQERYLFEDGVLYIQSVMEPRVNIVDDYLKLLQSFSKEDITAYYEKDSITYAESGKYTIGLVTYNSNTTILYVGEGEEARCNIITNLNYII